MISDSRRLRQELRINIRSGREITILREKDLDVRKFFVLIIIKTFYFCKAAPPGVKFVIRHSDHSEFRWNEKENMMLRASSIIVKLDAIGTKLVSFGSGI